jgi:two-component system, sensor histidine kinase PdtaS
MAGLNPVDFVGRVATLARARRTGWSAWGILVLLFALALAVRIVFAARLDPAPLAPFLPAVLIATLVCGWRKSLALVAASAVAGWFLFASRPAWFLMTPPFDVRVGAFLALSGFLMLLTEALAQAVQRLETAARLNADLFRELQHRVSNNFQIVAATLQKARRGIADTAALDAIDHAISRVNSLARLHRRLYDPNSYGGGFEPILREVLAETFEGLAVDVRIDIEPEALSIGQMTTIVLLVTEAAINAAKHVFRPQRGRTFAVSLRGPGPEKALTISDDGPGFAASENETTPRYGLTVMRGLAAQLGGTLEISQGAGATLRVAFKS